jgi:hypothetical protein
VAKRRTHTPLTAEQRHKLATAPLAALGIFRHGTSYPHGGTAVADSFFGSRGTKWAERDGGIQRPLGASRDVDDAILALDPYND